MELAIKNQELKIRSDVKMSKKENIKFFISCKVANLFLLSETSKDYPEIVNAMSYHNGLPRMLNSDFKKMSKDRQISLQNEWNDIFNHAQGEWSATKYEEKSQGKIINCELCGHKKISSIFKIKNLENQKELIVGSECIKYFCGIKNNSKEDRKLYLKDEREKRKVAKNIWYAESVVPGLNNQVKSFRRISDNHSFIMPNKLKKEYYRIENLIKEDYDAELKKPKSKIDCRKFVSTNSQITVFKEKLEESKQKYKNDKWQITENIARWCYNSKKDSLIERLSVTEKVDFTTADQIYETNYLHFIVEEFKSFLYFNNFKVLKNNSINFEVSSKFNEGIKILVDTVDFLKKYKANLFKNEYENISIKDLLRVSKISKDSYDNAAYLICRKCRYDYKYQFQSAEINEIAFKSENNILVLKYAEFINKFKNYIFKKKIDSKMNKEIVNYIEANSEKYTAENYSVHLKTFGIFQK